MANLHHSVDTSTVSLPHRSESRLASKIPAVANEYHLQEMDNLNSPLQSHMALGDALHVKSHRRY